MDCLVYGITRVGHNWATFTSLCCCSVVKTNLTLCSLTDCSMPGFPVLHYLQEFAQIHIELVMLSNHLILCPLLFLPSIFPSIRIFSNELALHIRWPKCWSFSISPSNEYSRLISFRIDRFDLLSVPLDSQESSPAPQLESISSSAISLLYDPTLTSVHDYWKNHSFDCRDLCQHSDVSAF